MHQYDDLHDDPELAFIELESTYRGEMQSKIEKIKGGYIGVYYIEYINRTLAAARALDLDILKDWKVPNREDDIDRSFEQFSLDVEFFIVQIQVRHGKRRKTYSVLIDHPTKEKIRHYISYIKDIIDKSDLPPRKREAIYSKINALLSEIERDRTRYEVIMDFILETSDVIEESSQKLNPLRKFIDSLTKLINSARQAGDEIKQIPGPSSRKKLEPPREDKSSSTKKQNTWENLDDDIPF